MKKSNKKATIAVLSVIGLLAIAGLVALILSGITKKNPEGVLGNTAGNIYNKGLFCENDGLIYFSNPDDDGALYCMTSDCTDIRKLYSDKVTYINVDSNYIYYARANHKKENRPAVILYSTGLFRINKTGNARLKSLSKSPCDALLLFGNTLYFQDYTQGKGLSLCKIATSGKGLSKITDEGIIPGSVYSGSLIYSGIDKDRNIYRMDLDTYEKNLILEDMSYFPIAVNDGIYYMDVTTYHICFTNYKGEAVELVSVPCATYNISNDGRYLYYQTDRLKTNYIGVLDLVTLDNTMIIEGNFKNLCVTEKFLFFTEFNNTETYAYRTDGSGNLNLFRPGKIK